MSAKPWRIRPDLHVISQHIQPGSRVLDIGCGDGELLYHLISCLQCTGTGVEKDPKSLLTAVARGVPLLDLDVDTELNIFAPDSYDVVVLSRTLPALTRPDKVLAQLRPIAPRMILTMPNFGLWRHRLRLLSGHMPESRDLPYSWYSTPNLHHATLVDLEPLLTDIGLEVDKRIPLSPSGRPRRLGQFGANLMASSAIYMLRRTS